MWPQQLVLKLGQQRSPAQGPMGPLHRPMPHQDAACKSRIKPEGRVVNMPASGLSGPQRFCAPPFQTLTLDRWGFWPLKPSPLPLTKLVQPQKGAVREPEPTVPMELPHTDVQSLKKQQYLLAFEGNRNKYPHGTLEDFNPLFALLNFELSLKLWFP